MSSYYELSTSDDAARDPDALQLIWSANGNTPTVRSSVDPWLAGFGTVSSPLIDLARIATGALIADRRSPRPIGWSREIRLRIHAVEPELWTNAMETVSALLQFLSGDVWDIELVQDASARNNAETEDPVRPTRDASMLFSGGLDSFCGALIGLQADQSLVFVSQRDNPTVGASQNRATDWLRANIDDTFDPCVVLLSQAQPIREGTSRTRSLLFIALGLAAAEAARAPRLVVPENGFTSINPPLRADRTGPLSTRSTHPYTFALLDLLRDQLGISVEVANPYEWLTKGELVARAAEGSDALPTGIATTLSCAKLDGRLYKGGNQNWNCGLCVACIVRRGAIAAAGLQDETPYVATQVTGSALTELLARRRPDIEAIKRALAVGVDEDALITDAEFPVDFDIDRALELWGRTLGEIALVDLP